MKFGRNLPRNQVPEWSSSYIDYKGLKKFIKSVVVNDMQRENVDVAGFFYKLDRNLEAVESFYNRRFAESSRRLQLLQDRYGRATESPDGIDRDEMEDLMGALLELRGQLRKLQWYGEVNRRGFIKITKKFDKKIPTVTIQCRYLESRVDPKPFATNSGITELMQTINDWLSHLGEAKLMVDKISVSSTTSSIKRVSSRAMLKLPMDLLNTVDQTVRKDDASAMAKLLMQIDTIDDDDGNSLQKLLLNLLQRSIACRAKACIILLLPKLATLEERDDINRRNCLHRLVIAIGRSVPHQGSDRAGVELADLDLGLDINHFITPAAPPNLAPPHCKSKEHEGIDASGNRDDSVQILEYVLEHLRPAQREAVRATDIYGRTPLHYAAQFGLVSITQILLRHMHEWGQVDVRDGIDALDWQDVEGWTPIHLSVFGNHPITTKALLDAEHWHTDCDDGAAIRKHVPKSGAVLALATKSNFPVLVELLVEAGFDINHQDEQGETALHIAARFGHEACAKLLIEGSEVQKANLELAEKTFAWTPLFIACVDGQRSVVELLIDAGAEMEKPDLSGWTVKEHAALRGHIAIAKKLAEVTTTSTIDFDASTAVSTSPPLSSSIEDRRSQPLSTTMRTSEPVKAFGHRYLTTESMVLVSLGTMDPRKIIDAVKLDRIPLADAHSTQLDTALSLVVSASHATGEPSIIDLPVQDNICTEPIVFTAVDISRVKLLFDIVPTYAGSKDKIVGRGVALLSSIKPSVGSQRINLQGDMSIPIMAANTLEVIGTVNFNFLLITPFHHQNLSIQQHYTYWKSLTSTMVIGHRGNGKNLASRKSLQLGENTIQSFIAAANLGASYVEFDVQLTKDHVPVIYHDFLVSETGIDAPVHTLTLEQFLHVNDAHTPRPSRSASPDKHDPRPEPRINGNRTEQGIRRTRSLSVGNHGPKSDADLSERMKHTRDYKLRGYKANSRGNFIQAPFTTLEEMFRTLPQHIGFNIEMKYPMLHESLEHEMDTYAVELNSFVDTVLKTVYDLSATRDVIFSSFNPDVCLLLSFKQPSIPILFLTDAGTTPVGDIRASSLQEAIRFASRWNLLGVVTAAEPLVIAPRLVKVVKESGLVCVSYGTINNDEGMVKRQVGMGIDAVIVDSVLAIRKGLTRVE